MHAGRESAELASHVHVGNYGTGLNLEGSWVSENLAWDLHDGWVAVAVNLARNGIDADNTAR